MRIARLLYVLCLALALVPSALSAAQSAPETALTNSDVVKMLKAGMPESVIIRYIQISRTSFAATPTALIDLRKHGASEAVLNAVLDSWTAGGMPYAEALPSSGMEIQGSGPHTARMPRLQAKVRVNHNVEQLSMGPNHVELKGKGMPSVSVEWQTAPPDR